MMSSRDTFYMLEALKLADNAAYHCPPNPAVGCVLVRDDRIIGRGFTQKVGSAHAEVMALRDAESRSEKIEGATAYVTLEPCSHWGRTPPCALALINAKVARVVAALKDPNPLVAGRGLNMLKEAGIEVTVGVCEKEAYERNIGFIRRMVSGVPFVRAKMAMSLDGKTALTNGKSQWITGPEARSDGYCWRARAGSILTGSGTVRDDDPQLNVRLEGVERQPLRVVLDSRMSLDTHYRIFSGSPTLLVCAEDDPEKKKAFEEAGVEVLLLPGDDGRIDLHALMRELGNRGVNELHVEAGATLTGALSQAGLINEYLIYVAPKILGEGRNLLKLPMIEELSEAKELKFISMDRTGGDIRLILRPDSKH